MADHGTAIEWTQAPGYKGETWNPVTGCDRVSPGCAHCYALDLAARLKGMGQKRYQRDGDPKTSGPGFGLTLHPDKLEEPLRWRKPRMVFVNSMSDLFHEGISNEYIAAVFGVMAKAERHVFQVLTKRPERMRAWFKWFAEEVRERELWHDPLEVALREAQVYGVGEDLLWPPFGDSVDLWPLPNVWLGVSIENRRFVQRADLLRETPAAVRFISAEPLLGPLAKPDGVGCRCGWPLDSCNPQFAEGGACDRIAQEGPHLDLADIDWLIVGGESGKGHRRLDRAWMEDLRDAAATAGTAYFVKQMGGFRPGNRLEDLPDGLRIREFPRGRVDLG